MSKVITKIDECQHCGMRSEDYPEDDLHGFNDTCIHCGAEDGCFEILCPCGSFLLWNEYGEQLKVECPVCGESANNYIVTAFDSAFIINEILKRPDLHKKRSWVPISFVETLIQLKSENIQHSE